MLQKQLNVHKYHVARFSTYARVNELPHIIVRKRQYIAAQLLSCKLRKLSK